MYLTDVRSRWKRVFVDAKPRTGEVGANLAHEPENASILSIPHDW